MKIWTIRIPDELDKAVTELAKEKDMSKNQVVKKALRQLLELESNDKCQ